MADPADYLATVRTASEVVADLDPTTWGGTDVDADAKSRAATAGVSKVEFISYKEAMANYEARNDVESLANRRAREVGATFAATDFVRDDSYDPFA